MALTVGVATVLDSREVVVIVTGQRKSLALSKAIGACRFQRRYMGALTFYFFFRPGLPVGLIEQRRA